MIPPLSKIFPPYEPLLGKGAFYHGNATCTTQQFIAQRFHSIIEALFMLQFL